MNREILFRGKCIKDGKWKQGYYFKSWDKEYIAWGTSNGAPMMEEVDPKTFGEFVGMIDKNGRKLFEGDIIAYEDDYDGTKHVGQVAWMGKKLDYPAFDIVDHQQDVNMLSFLICMNGFEIVGNIFDNPELLEL